MRAQEMEQGFSPFDFHHGKALLRVANSYPTLMEVILENIQNSLDAFAQNIWVKINCDTRSGIISDDGIGTTKTKFEKALRSVCDTLKEETDLGQFGIGLISPLGKCDNFTFTSTPKSDPRLYVQWSFSTEEIEAQDKIHKIPHRLMKELHFERDPSSKGGIPWRTQVRLSGITKDRLKSKVTLPTLREAILERYSAKMSRLGTRIFAEIVKNDIVEKDTIVAEKFQGKRLQIEYIKEDFAGQTAFKLYISPKTAKGREGKVLIGQECNDFRISFRSFAKHAGGFLSGEVLDAFFSGIFEGEILTEKAALDSGRRHFEENDALVGLCIAIDKWFEETGKKHIEKIKEESQDQRYQVLGLRSIKVVEALLSQPEFEHLREIVKSFSAGTIGVHHVIPNVKIIGLQPEKSTSTQGEEGGKKERTSSSGRPPKGREEPENEHTEHTPYTVSGPKGRQRMVVKGNSTGLQFLYSEMEGSDKLWDLNTDIGVLTFNTRHPLWAQCEPDEKCLMRFQEHIAIVALTLETVPPEWKDRHRQMVDDLMPSVVFWLLKGDEIAGRKPGRKSKNPR